MPEATAECRVCGQRVTYAEAPLHAEDHAQRGEFPACAAIEEVRCAD